MSSLIKKLLFPIVLLLSALALTLTAMTDISAPQPNDSAYTLKSYKNTIALYKDEELITVYDGIVLNTLPEKDIQSFNSGIAVATPAEADILLEDYDS